MQDRDDAAAPAGLCAAHGIDPMRRKEAEKQRIKEGADGRGDEPCISALLLCPSDPLRPHFVPEPERIRQDGCADGEGLLPVRKTAKRKLATLF